VSIGLTNRFALPSFPRIGVKKMSSVSNGDMWRILMAARPANSTCAGR